MGEASTTTFKEEFLTLKWIIFHVHLLLGPKIFTTFSYYSHSLFHYSPRLLLLGPLVWGGKALQTRRGPGP